MRKFTKRLTSFIMAVAMMLSTSTAVFAANNSDIDKASTLEPRIADIISMCYENKVNDKTKFSYGSAVPVYNYTDGSISESEKIKMYPVYINDSLSGYIRETIDSGVSYLSYSEEFANEVSELNSNKYNFVVTADDFYVLSDNAVKNLSNVCVSTKKLITLDDSQLSSMKYYFNNSATYNFALVSFSNANSKSNNITEELDIPTWNQGSSDLCWAGCVEAVGEYMTNNMYFSPETIASTMKISGGASNSQIKDALEKIYFISTEASTAIPVFSYVVYKINNGKPIIANLQSPSAGHVMTIIGYGATSSSTLIKVMDTLGGVYRVLEVVNGKISICYNIETFEWDSAVIPS